MSSMKRVPCASDKMAQCMHEISRLYEEGKLQPAPVVRYPLDTMQKKTAVGYRT